MATYFKLMSHLAFQFFWRTLSRNFFLWKLGLGWACLSYRSDVSLGHNKLIVAYFSSNIVLKQLESSLWKVWRFSRSRTHSIPRDLCGAWNKYFVSWGIQCICARASVKLGRMLKWILCVYSRLTEFSGC